jgi:NAD(P)-dependent dehydrogenase (short-subunit alcohol dehydrogenase family)
MRSVVVTGASTGIGAATARVLAADGFRVFGSVRRETDAEPLARELGPRFVPLVFDVTDREAVQAAARHVEVMLEGQTLAGLVNNAGIAVVGPLLHLDPDAFRRQLEVNVTSQLVVTQAFLPLLGTRGTQADQPGRVVMMSSMGGRNASPFLGPYNSSKFALEGLSESLRRELMLFGIDVVIIAPGAVATPIWDKADAIDIAAYAGSPYAASLAIAKEIIAAGRRGFPPERVGRAVLLALTATRPKTRYILTPTPVHHWMVRLLPKRIVDRLIARRLGLLPARPGRRARPRAPR